MQSRVSAHAHHCTEKQYAGRNMSTIILTSLSLYGRLANPIELPRVSTYTHRHFSHYLFPVGDIITAAEITSGDTRILLSTLLKMFELWGARTIACNVWKLCGAQISLWLSLVDVNAHESGYSPTRRCCGFYLESPGNVYWIYTLKSTLPPFFLDSSFDHSIVSAQPKQWKLSSCCFWKSAIIIRKQGILKKNTTPGVITCAVIDSSKPDSISKSFSRLIIFFNSHPCVCFSSLPVNDHVASVASLTFCSSFSLAT